VQRFLDSVRILYSVRVLCPVRVLYPVRCAVRSPQSAVHLLSWPVKILSRFRSLFGNDFHWSGTDCTIGIKILFLSWRLKSSNGRLIRNNKCWLGCYLLKPKVHTRNTKPLAAVVFNRFDITGNFSQFSGTFLCIYSRLLKKLFFTVL